MWGDALAIGITLVTVISVSLLNRQETKWVQTILDWFPPILFSYVIPAAITHLFRLDLSSVYLHSLSRNWIIPVAILTVMSSMSFQKLKQVGIKPILLFFSGSLAIAILAPLLVWTFNAFIPSSKDIFIEQAYWRGLVPLVGSWIGGSTSQLVLKELVRCPESIFLSVIVLDNILVNIWTIIMFQSIKRSEAFGKWLRITDTILPIPKAIEDNTKGLKKPTIPGAATLAIIILITGIITLLADDFLTRLVVLSLLGLALGNFIPPWDHSFVLQIGGILIILIMAILGLRLDFANLSLPLIFVLLCIVWIVGHYVILVLMAKLLNVHMTWVPIASMANVGGISTAPAVAAAHNKQLMPHAILLAILSMVTSNLWGLLTIYLFNQL